MSSVRFLSVLALLVIAVPAWTGKAQAPGFDSPDPGTVGPPGNAQSGFNGPGTLGSGWTAAGRSPGLVGPKDVLDRVRDNLASDPGVRAQAKTAIAIGNTRGNPIGLLTGLPGLIDATVPMAIEGLVGPERARMASVLKAQRQLIADIKTAAQPQTQLKVVNSAITQLTTSSASHGPSTGRSGNKSCAAAMIGASRVTGRSCAAAMIGASRAAGHGVPSGGSRSGGSAQRGDHGASSGGSASGSGGGARQSHDHGSFGHGY